MQARVALLRHARRLYRNLPGNMRRRINPAAGAILRLLGGGAGNANKQQAAGAGITVAGLFSSPCGLGEGARLCADALLRLGWHVERLDLAPSLGIDTPVLRHDPEPMLATGPVIVHLNPPLFRRALPLIGRRRLRGREVIGYWAWELEDLPSDWRRAARGLREVWTPSCFSAAALSRTLRVPVRVVPHPVVPRPAIAQRAAFGLPERVCVFLVFANLRSNLARKNPQAAIAAYARAFAEAREDVLLVIKLDGVDAAPGLAAALRTEAAACPCPVHFLSGTLDRATRDSLIASCDVLVSLHRSEGFGLTLAEAMALGRPVVATAWSGNLDFMSSYQAALVRAELVPVDDPQGFYDTGMRWAEPSIAEAAKWLSRLAGSPALRNRLASSGALVGLPERFEAALRETSLPGGPRNPRPWLTHSQFVGPTIAAT